MIWVPRNPVPPTRRLGSPEKEHMPLAVKRGNTLVGTQLETRHPHPHPHQVPLQVHIGSGFCQNAADIACVNFSSQRTVLLSNIVKKQRRVSTNTPLNHASPGVKMHGTRGPSTGFARFEGKRLENKFHHKYLNFRSVSRVTYFCHVFNLWLTGCRWRCISFDIKAFNNRYTIDMNWSSN